MDARHHRLGPPSLASGVALMGQLLLPSGANMPGRHLLHRSTVINIRGDSYRLKKGARPERQRTVTSLNRWPQGGSILSGQCPGAGAPVTYDEAGTRACGAGGSAVAPTENWPIPAEKRPPSRRRLGRRRRQSAQRIEASPLFIKRSPSWRGSIMAASKGRTGSD